MRARDGTSPEGSIGSSLAVEANEQRFPVKMRLPPFQDADSAGQMKSGQYAAISRGAVQQSFPRFYAQFGNEKA